MFRTDASTAIGGGHVMRCLALAEALAKEGWHCSFAGTPETPQAVKALGQSRFAFLALMQTETKSVVAQIAKSFDKADAIIVDHYELDAVFESEARRLRGTMIVIDDLCDRPHDCDMLIDQGWRRKSGDYAALVPAGAVLLLGSEYALLRAEFARLRPQMRRRDRIGRILLGLGATDPERLTAPALQVLLKEFEGPIDVVLGSGAPDLDRVSALCEGSAHRAVLHVDATDVAELMLAADLAVGGGGIGTWERCCLGLPTLLIVTALNQADNAAALEAEGAGIVLSGIDGIAPALRALMGNRPRLAAMSDAAARLCDGRGAARVAAEIASRA